MTTSGPSTAATGAGSGSKPVSQPLQHSEAVKEKKELASWWKNFRRGDKKGQEQASQGIFGVPLQTSIRYANVAISLFNDDGKPYIYGYVPIVVAKCGVYLKEKATDVEGIFRLAGSEKRIKELRQQFDSPDRYGKGLDWTGYTVHDAANILRRYFNQLPEPIIPLNFYHRFRDPLRNHQAQAVGAIEAQSPSEGSFNHNAAIKTYQDLITELPPLNRQLLLYILDLLAVFASKSDLNKMTTANLAAIFQPGILSHPEHDMAPKEYRLSQDVLIFLIENQDNFLIGMAGTAADNDTVREVQSGTSVKPPTTPTTPSRAKTVIGRSGSNSSVAAESVRKFGSIRRNVSVSSKHSKRSEHAQPPGTPNPQTPTNGVHRSNTVPSRRGGSTTQSPRFAHSKHSDPSTPNLSSNEAGSNQMVVVAGSIIPATVVETSVPRPVTAERRSSAHSIQHTPTTVSPPTFPAPPGVTSASSSEATTPLANVGQDTASATSRDYQTPKRDTAPLLPPSSDKTERSASNTPSTAGRKGFLDILKQSPHNDSESRKPKKLQKKQRIPGSALSSAQSSSQDLHGEAVGAERSPISPTFASLTTATEASEVRHENGEQSAYATAQNAPTLQSTPQRNPTDATLKPTISPSNSFTSHTDTSDADMVGDDMPVQGDNPAEKKKRHRWRFSRSQNRLDQPPTPSNPFSTMSAKEQAMSRSTIGSGGSQPRKSFQEPTSIAAVPTEPLSPQGIQPAATSDTVFSDSERERKSGALSWFRNKIQERKDKEVEKRSHTPERGQVHDRTKSRQETQVPASESLPVRGPSLDQNRTGSNMGPGSPSSQQTTVPAAAPAPSPAPKSAAVSVAVAAANGAHASHSNAGFSSATSSVGTVPQESHIPREAKSDSTI